LLPATHAAAGSKPMLEFAIIWGGSFAALVATVVALHWIYRLLGSDFGLNGWKSELPTAMVAAAMQAGVFFVAAYLTREGAGVGGATRFALIFSVLFLCGCYKVTHLSDLDGIDLAILAAVDHVILFTLAAARS
jgi:hypothetical protein